MAAGDHDEINARLAEEALWESFHKHTTEMIVTRAGRKVFPKISVDMSGLRPTTYYGVRLYLERADKYKYRFANGSWTAHPDDDEPIDVPFTTCNDGFIQSGSEWMSKPVEFTHFKLTNNMDDRQLSMLKVQSLHKYVPTIVIYESLSGRPSIQEKGMTQMRFLKMVPLSKAEFVVVTAYQNEAIRKLKTQHNPFAKGIRSQSYQASPVGSTCSSILSGSSSSSSSSPRKRRLSHMSSPLSEGPTTPKRELLLESFSSPPVETSTANLAPPTSMLAPPTGMLSQANSMFSPPTRMPSGSFQPYYPFQPAFFQQTSPFGYPYSMPLPPFTPVQQQETATEGTKTYCYL